MTTKKRKSYLRLNKKQKKTTTNRNVDKLLLLTTSQKPNVKSINFENIFIF